MIERHEIATELLKRDPEIIVAGFEILLFLAKHGKFPKEDLKELVVRHHIAFDVNSI